MANAAVAKKDTAASPATEIVGVVPYLNVSDANAAIAFYQKAFGAEVVDRRLAQDGKRLIHSQLRINGGPLMLNDPFPEFGFPSKTPQSFMLHLQVDDVDAWWKRAVDAGATVVMPLDKQFWGDRYGQVSDPYGIVWSIGGSADR